MPEPMLASSLCAPLLDGPPQLLQVLHRSACAYQLADARGRVRVCLATAAAVRLPHCLIVRALPAESSDVAIGAGALRWGDRTYRAARWWRPQRPALPALARRIRPAPIEALIRGWRAQLGRGAGLTPYGDDVICGALVALRAADDPRATGWSRAVLELPLEGRTTATSAALLRLAAHGWCIDAVAGYLASLASGADATAEAEAVLAVGSSSGRGLLEGITTVCGGAASMLAAAA